MSVIDKLGMGPTRTELDNKDGTWTICVTPPAFVGGPPVYVKLSSSQMEGYRAWRKGDQMIQDALPSLSAADREALMTGLVD